MIHTINFKRIICLMMALLVLGFCVIRPVTAHATTVAVAATAVAVPAPIVVGAVLVGLGIMVGVEIGAFDNLVDICSAQLQKVGYIVDGMIDSWTYDGKSYVPTDVVNVVRNQVFASSVVSNPNYNTTYYGSVDEEVRGKSMAVCVIGKNDAGKTRAYKFYVSTIKDLVLQPSNKYTGKCNRSYHGLYYSDTFSYSDNCGLDYTYPNFYNWGVLDFGSESLPSSVEFLYPYVPISVNCSTSEDLILGSVAPISQSIDTGYESWTIQGVQLYQWSDGSYHNEPEPDNDDSVSLPYLPVSVGQTYTETVTQTQETAQQGNYSYQTGTDTGTDTGSNNGSGTSTSAISQSWLGTQIDNIISWLTNIYNGILSIPSTIVDAITSVYDGLMSLVDFFTGTSFVESPLVAINFDDLFDLFPFNIPYGIYQTVNFWSSGAKAPTLVIPLPNYGSGGLGIYEYEINFSDIPGMDVLAAMLRAGELILFAIGLVMITRKVTKW